MHAAIADHKSDKAALPVSLKNLFQYGFLAIPMAFAGLPLFIHAPDFYVTQTSATLAAIGLILVFIRIFDAVQDPFIGYLSDTYSHMRGYFLGGSVLVLALSFLMLFMPYKDAPVIWFGISVILASSAFTVIMINLNALGSLWSRDHHEKTKITGFREAFGLVGLLLAAAVPDIFKKMFPIEDAFLYYALILCGIAAIAGSIFLRWYGAHKNALEYTHNLRISKDERVQPLERFKAFFKYLRGDNRLFFATYFFSMLASAIPAVLVIFFIRDRLELESLTGMFLLLYFLSGAIGMPLWQFLAKRFGKLWSWAFSMILAMVVFIWAFMLGAGDAVSFGFICTLSGLALGAELALPPSILSDLIDKEQSHNGTSSQFSILAFISKSAFALGSGLAFLLLDFGRFEPAQINSEDALFMLSLTYALIPCLIKFGAVLMIFIWIKNDSALQPSNII